VGCQGVTPVALLKVAPSDKVAAATDFGVMKDDFWGDLQRS
jgi:hypothetical protein